jgi:outer membrane protein assembly factor BamB
MTTDPVPASPSLAPPKSRRALPIVRLILAIGVTAGVLVYAWARVLVMTKLQRKPEWEYLAMFGGGLAAVMLLTFRLSDSFPSSRLRRGVLLGIALLWVVGFSLVVFLNVNPEPDTPLPAAMALFVVAGLWVPWAAWMGFVRVRWLARGLVLGLLLAAGAGSMRLMRFALTGDADLIVGLQLRDDGLSEEEADTVTPAAGAVADLAPTSHDYAQFMGPERLGVLPDARLSRHWDRRPPRLLWRQEVGAGWSAFAVVGDFAVTQEQRGSQECVVCYRVADGKTVWLHGDKARFDTSMGGLGPRATPTIANDRVYTVGATGILNCLDGATGRKRWSVNILTDNHAENIAHGVCGSPMVLGDWVIVCPTGAGGPSLAAYHRKTGKRAWQTGTDQGSYGSLLFAKLHGVPQILLYTSQGVTAHDPDTRRLLWSFPWTNNMEINCSQPIPHAGAANHVLVSTGYGKGAALFRVRHEGGEWTTEMLWENRRFRTKFTTAVVRDGYAYGLDEGYLACLDLKTGRVRWKGEHYEHGQVLLAGDLLLVQAEKGYVALVEASPERFRELHRLAALKGRTWNNPALAGRYLLVRKDRQAACYELPLAE